MKFCSRSLQYQSGSSLPALKKLRTIFLKLKCWLRTGTKLEYNTPGSFAPTAIRWGRDNRTCALRLVGNGQSLRLENRVPGGDVNPYLAVAGIIAAGLDGIKNNLKLEPAYTTNAYDSDSPRVPATMLEAQQLWANSAWVKEVFGEQVQAHYANMAQVELDAYGKAVTDWELFRNFERF